MKAIEQYFPVVLFAMLHKMVFTFESVDEILKCDHFFSSTCTTLHFGTPIMLWEPKLTNEHKTYKSNLETASGVTWT